MHKRECTDFGRARGTKGQGMYHSNLQLSLWRVCSDGANKCTDLCIRFMIFAFLIK